MLLKTKNKTKIKSEKIKGGIIVINRRILTSYNRIVLMLNFNMHTIALSQEKNFSGQFDKNALMPTFQQKKVYPTKISFSKFSVKHQVILPTVIRVLHPSDLLAHLLHGSDFMDILLVGQVCVFTILNIHMYMYLYMFALTKHR